jgi:hypothetical protein
MKLYYLTPAQFALSALALRRLKVARLGELNDPFELLAINAETPQHLEFFRRVKEKIDLTHGVLCFTKSWKNPVLWGHYADKLRGVALGFEVTSPHLLPVIYAKTPAKIETNPKTGLPQMNDDLVDQLQRTKFEDWRYEEEMRVYVQLDHDMRESGLYFYPFDSSIVLTEIVLGPRCELPIASLIALFGSSEQEIKIIKSRLDSRSFSVVEATV